MTNDFTSGSPIKHIIRFAHPLAWLFGDLLLIPAFWLCMRMKKESVQ